MKVLKLFELKILNSGYKKLRMGIPWGWLLGMSSKVFNPRVSSIYLDNNLWLTTGVYPWVYPMVYPRGTISHMISSRVPSGV